MNGRAFAFAAWLRSRPSVRWWKHADAGRTYESRCTCEACQKFWNMSRTKHT